MDLTQNSIKSTYDYEDWEKLLLTYKFLNSVNWLVFKIKVKYRGY